MSKTDYYVRTEVYGRPAGSNETRKWKFIDERYFIGQSWSDGFGSRVDESDITDVPACEDDDE